MKGKYILIFLICCCFGFSKNQIKQLFQFVNPRIGTSDHGHVFMGASAPFGFVQLGPTTRKDGWDACSGYHASDNVMFGFTHTALSGTGVGDLNDILFMPVNKKIENEMAEPYDYTKGYCSTFSKQNEIAEPGYYSVILDRYKIKAELTATQRAGFHQYTFPKSDSSNIIIDLKYRDVVISSGVKIVNNSEIEGFRRSSGWATNQQIYFVVKFSKPFLSAKLFKDNLITSLQEGEGQNLKLALNYKTTEGEIIQCKVGISAVSIEGARKNLEDEIIGFDFDAVKKATQALWNKELSKIVIDATEDIKTIFYTAFYHTMIAPNVFTDVDKNYRGMDNQIHKAENYTHYTLFSLWDTYRTLHPLFTVIDQKRTTDFINTFISQYEQKKQLPIWELDGNETGCMIGYHAVSVIADAYVKGIIGFDEKKAFEAMVGTAEKDNLGKREYIKEGYVPTSKEIESVSRTLEYAYNDWCIAQMASKMGNTEAYKTFIKRAQSYKNIFDTETKFVRPKDNGKWLPFDPLEVSTHFTEANAWPYSFYVPHDITGLIKLYGGKKVFEQKLDSLFSMSSKMTGRELPDITGLIGQYVHGNEPSHQIAYMYSYVNKPWKSQEKLHYILTNFYSSKENGIIGNEDCGQMSAWYVMSAMGFYPVCPGSPDYIIGCPILNKAVINLENKKQFIITTKSLTATSKYIKAVKYNGQAYTKSIITHNMIMQGGTLEFEMSEKPCYTWGSKDEDISQSSIKE